MKYFSFILLLFFGLLLCVSCDKENIDLDETEEEEVVPEIIECDIVLDILEEPASTLTANIDGGTVPYSFLWSTEETTNSIQVNISGIFSVTVTDAEGCTKEQEIEIDNITECEPIIADGSITLPEGGSINIDTEISPVGIAPFTYQWSTGETGPIFTPLESGFYSVTITDAEACIIIFDFELIFECEGFDVQLPTTATGFVTAIVSGGTPPYEWFWHNGLTTPSIPTVGTGTYSVTVEDANGCLVIETALVKVHDDSCDGLQVELAESNLNNSIRVEVSGGSGNYDYQWSDGSDSNPIMNLVASGQYNVTVTDLNDGCKKEVSIAYYLSDNCTGFAVKVIEPSPGTISLLACGGAVPYSYSWSIGETSQVLSNLASGIYIISITDSDGCSVLVDYVVDLQEQCNGFGTEIFQDATGQLSTVSCGGTEPFSYLWSTGETSSTATPSSSGTYSVTITDAIDCTTTDTIQL
jgi:hypothetical protein